MVYGPRSQIDRAPLPPPAGYTSPPTRLSPNERTEAQAEDHPGWSASPRWAAVKGGNCIEVQQDLQAPSQLSAKRC
jgi:hypothetical protein